MFAFTGLQLCEVELGYTKILNGCYEFFTNMFKFLEHYINNLNIQQTTPSFKNKNAITNKSVVDPKLANTLEVEKQTNEVRKLNLESKNTNSTTNGDIKKLNSLESLNNKYFIGTVIVGIILGVAIYFNPDLPATCFNGLKNLIWKNNINKPQQDQTLPNIPEVHDNLHLQIINNDLNTALNIIANLYKPG